MPRTSFTAVSTAHPYDDIAARLADLPAFHDWRDVQRLAADNDPDRFLDLWVSDALPPAVRATCLQTLPVSTFSLLLLRRLVRGQDALLVAQQAQLAVIQALVELLTDRHPLVDAAHPPLHGTAVQQEAAPAAPARSLDADDPSAPPDQVP